ncbi:uncharacterized protein F5Z01DRAFT_650616 [Emericellopsis atlantica]|uniref:Centromere protein Scm3 n=1 Tax=Emericellopsis atlantica TaxID=2614577 RepID=A0A9P7ZPM3_9HYPO|nr:uncharacterized protein F5Z01DRAFT_650616 [Emericellopsis atlantica]KAG9255953.1 hypothetical protein F5Z01DRAFT_650616 [Emericellopsis atlantica]
MMASPPAKRLKLTGYDPYDERDPSDEDEGDELELEPEEVSEMRHPDFVLERKRARAVTRYEQAMAGIIAKYSRDFEDVGDELDLNTGAIVVDRGHLRNMRYDTDLGMEDESGGNECEDEDEGVLLCDISDDWGDQAAVATQQADSVFLGGLETASSVSEKCLPNHTMQRPKPRKGRPGKSAKDFEAISIWTPEADDEDDWVPYPRRRKSTMGALRRAMAMPNIAEDGWVSATDRDAGSDTGLDENPDNLMTNGMKSDTEYALASKPYQPTMQTRVADSTHVSRKDASSKSRRVMNNRAQSPSGSPPVPDTNGDMVEDGYQNSAEDDVHANLASFRRSGRERRQVEFLGKVAWPKRKERESKDAIDIAPRSDNIGDSESNKREVDALDMNATKVAGNNEGPEEPHDCNASAAHGDLAGSSCFVIAIPARVRCDEYQHVEDIPDDPTLPTPPESSHEASEVNMGHKDVSVERMTIPDSESEPMSVLDENTPQPPTIPSPASNLLATECDSPASAIQISNDPADSVADSIRAGLINPLPIETTVPLVGRSNTGERRAERTQSFSEPGSEEAGASASEQSLAQVQIHTSADQEPDNIDAEVGSVDTVKRHEQDGFNTQSPDPQCSLSKSEFVEGPTSLTQFQPESSTLTCTEREPCDASESDMSPSTQPTNPAAPPSRPDSTSGYSPDAAETSVTQAAESAISTPIVPRDHGVTDQDLADPGRTDKTMENDDTSPNSANNAPAGEPSNATLETGTFPARQKRGRPRKNQSLSIYISNDSEPDAASLSTGLEVEPEIPPPSEQVQKRKRGRPRKSLTIPEEELPQTTLLETPVDSTPLIEPGAEPTHDIETMSNGTPEQCEPTTEDVPTAAADVTEAPNVEGTETTVGAQNTISEDDTAPIVDAEIINDVDVGSAAEAQPDPFLPQLQIKEDGLQQTIADSDDPPPFPTDNSEGPDTAQPQLPPLELSPEPKKTLEPGMEANHPKLSRQSDVASSSPSRRLKRLSLAKPSTPRHRTIKKMNGASSSRQSLVSLLSTADADEDELLRSDELSPLVGHSAVLGGRKSVTPIRRSWKPSILTTEVYRTPLRKKGKRDRVPTSIAQDPSNGNKTCGVDGYRCEADFCFTCLQ